MHDQSRQVGELTRLLRMAESRISQLEELESAARDVCNTPPGDWKLVCNGEAFNRLDEILRRKVV